MLSPKDKNHITKRGKVEHEESILVSSTLFGEDAADAAKKKVAVKKGSGAP